MSRVVPHDSLEVRVHDEVRGAIAQKLSDCSSESMWKLSYASGCRSVPREPPPR